MRNLIYAFFLAVFLGPSLHGQQQAIQSDNFVDSVGINIHLHYDQTLYYNNFPLIQKSLVNLGVRHLRDGLVDTTLQAYYDRHNALGQLGMKTIFISNATETASLYESYPSRVASAFEGYENPNELDGTDGWVAILNNSMPILYQAALATTPRYPVIGPSLTQTASYTALGNQSGLLDIGNIHNYYAGRNPGTPGFGDNGYGSIPFNLQNERIVSGNKPIWSTETGYDNNPATTNYVSEAVSAMYLPRLLLEQWNAGIQRTYLYELLSEGGQDFGLMRGDGSYKPAYYAVSNLLNLLSDKGAPFTPGTLDYTINGGDTTLHHLLLQKRDGSFYLALWVEAQDYDPDAHTDTPVPAQNITLQLKQPLATATRYQWGADGNIATTPLQTLSGIPLTVTGQLQIVRLTTQANCAYTVDSSTLPSLNNGLYAMGSNGGSASFHVSAPAGCSAQPVITGSGFTASLSGSVLNINAGANSGGFRLGTIMLGGTSTSFLQAAAGYAFVQVNSNIANASILVDGQPVLANSWLTWRTGDHHTLGGDTLQQVGPQVYLFDNWTAGAAGTSDVAVTAPSQTTTYTSHLTAANYLDAAATEGGNITLSPIGPKRFNLPYYRATDHVTVHATAAPGCTFQSWAGASSTTTPILPLQVQGPASLVGVFSCNQ